MSGTLPTIAAADPARGTKLLRPNAATTACDSSWFWGSTEPGDLLAVAFRTLIAADEEAAALDNARVTASGWSVGIYGRRCVTVSGDLVRPVSTVMLPMGGHGEHGEHGAH